MTGISPADSFKIKIFIQRFYSFVDGVLQRHGDIDDLLSKVGLEHTGFPTMLMT